MVSRMVVHASALSSFLFLHIAVEVILQERGPMSTTSVEENPLFSLTKRDLGGRAARLVLGLV